MEWYFIPATLQYIVAGTLSLLLGFYVFYKSRGSMASKFFMLFSIFLALWQFLIFLHRNAPNAFLSKTFFALGTGFASLMLPALFLTISFLQDGSMKHLVALVPNLVFFAFILIFSPFEVFWTKFGWSYVFTYGVSSYMLLPLTIFYIVLNYVWIIKPIRESRSSFVRRKYKFILFGFTILFVIGVVIFNTILLYVFPETLPLGGIATSIGLSMITFGILLKEKMQETQLSILYEDLSKKTSLFLQRVFSLMEEDVLGQRYLKFDKYLKETGISEYAVLSGGKVSIQKEPDYSRLVRIIDKTLEYIESGELPYEVINDLVKFWDSINPLIESDSVAMIKAHEDLIKKARILHELADGKLRNIFLPKGFSEENLDGFSRHLGFTHKDLFGNPVLVEIDPSERYEEFVKAYIYEVLANCEELAVFTRRGSRILKYLPSEQTYIFYLSSEASKRVAVSEREVELPLYNLTHLLGELSLAAKKTYSLLIDNLTDLYYSIGFEKTYRFTRSAIEISSSFRIPALFLITEKHDEKTIAAFENLFPTIVKIREHGIIKVK